MPWNGAGSFSRTNGVNTGTEVWQDDASTVQTILSDRHDTHDQDIADGLNIALTKDGQSWPPTANLDMGTFKFTDVGDATARNQYLSLGQFQDAGAIWCGTAGGTADALTLTVTPAIAGYSAGMTLHFTVAADNTGAVTANVSGQGARAINDLFGNPLVAGSLKVGMTIEIIDTGTEFRFNGERKIITAQGDIIVGDPSGDPTALGLGAINTVLGSDGTKNTYFGGTESKTANYTVALADHKKTILVDATAAAVTITLPAAASADDGFEITVEKADSSINLVDIDADGTETIDAPGGNRLSVNLPSQFDRFKLVCDGTKWTAIEHRVTYVSPLQNMVNAGLVTVAHGFGVEPNSVEMVAQATAANNNYSVGDRIRINPQMSDNTANAGMALWADATNVYVRYTNSNSFQYYNKTTGSVATMQYANWDLEITAVLQ